jgi:hypothetical protein
VSTIPLIRFDQKRLSSCSQEEREPLVKRGSGERFVEARGAPVGKRSSGEKAGSNGSKELGRSFSHVYQSSPLASPKEGGLMRSFSISPRIHATEMACVAAEIEKFFFKGFPAPILHVISQASCNQYAFLSEDGYVLAAALAKERLLDIFLHAITFLTSADESPVKVKEQRNLLVEIGLRMLIQPHAAGLISDPYRRSIVDHIVSAQWEKPPSPKSQDRLLKAQKAAKKFQYLLLSAQTAVELGRPDSYHSEKIAERGNRLISEWIKDSSHEASWKKIQAQQSENEGWLQAHKTFLLAMSWLLLQKSGNVDFNHDQQETLFQLGLRVVIFPEAAWITDPDIGSVVERIACIKWEREPSQKFKTLLQKAKKAVKERGPHFLSSEEISKKGISLISQWVEGSKRQKIWEKLRGKMEDNHGSCQVQETFLQGIRKLLLKESDQGFFNQAQKESLFQWGLQVLSSPDMPLLDTHPLWDSLKVKKLGEKLISASAKEFNSPTIQMLGCSVHAVITTPLISLKELQFLLLWIQSDFPRNKETMDLIAGLREGDSEGSIYHFAVHRFLELIEKTKDPIPLTRLLQFIHDWREVPANQDLAFKPAFFNKWKRLQSVFQTNPVLKKELGEDWIKEIFAPREPVPLPIFPKIQVFNPLHLQEVRSSSVPLSIWPIWKDKEVVKKLHDSIVFYLLEPRRNVEISDLFAPEGESRALSKQAQCSEQVTECLGGQFLACQTVAEVREFVEIVSEVQIRLLKSAAYEAAQAVHSVFGAPPIVRLLKIFLKDKRFNKLYEPPHAACCQLNGGKELKRLQEENPNAFEVFSLFSRDLDRAGVNPYRFTEKGEVNLDRLKALGALLNRFVERTRRTFEFWTAQEDFNPHPFFLQVFESQPVGFSDERMARSKVIHPEGSLKYWDIELPSPK